MKIENKVFKLLSVAEYFEDVHHQCDDNTEIDQNKVEENRYV